MMTHIFTVTMPGTLAEFEELLAAHNVVYPGGDAKPQRMQADVDKYKGKTIKISHKMNKQGVEELSHYTVNNDMDDGPDVDNNNS